MLAKTKESTLKQEFNIPLLLELKIVDSIYFYFIFHLFYFLNLELGFSMMSQIFTHQSYIT